MYRIIITSVIILLLLLTSCEKLFDYSPYVIDFDEDNTNVNIKNINKIISDKNEDSVIRIAFTGDSHRKFDELGGFVKSVNSLNISKHIDFVVHVGDIADFGLPKQYLWGNEYLLKLNVPYIMVIGNHDLVGNGGDAYKQMFGDFHYSFVYEKVKFIIVNSNSLEFNYNGKVPDINWLDSELMPSESFDKAVVIFHIPPTLEEFDQSLMPAFVSTLSRYDNVLFTVHGHLHCFDIYTPFPDSITYVNVYGVEFKKFNVIEIRKNAFKVSTYSF